MVDWKDKQNYYNIIIIYRSILKNKRKVNIDDKAQQLGISAAEIFLDIIL